MTEQRSIPVRRRSLACGLSAALAIGGLTDTSAASGRPATPPALKLLGNTLAVTSCADDGGPGALRSVVGTAVSGDTIDLTQLDCSTITLLNGQIEVHLDDLTINGPGQTLLTIDGNYNDRVLLHDGRGMLTISGLTIAHGIADFQNVNPDHALTARGGCIRSYLAQSAYSNFGGVTLIDVTVTSCQVIATQTYNGTYAITAEGGGVDASGDITLYRSTISDNEAVCTNCIVSVGGGISSRYGVVQITDSVVTRNSSIAYYGTYLLRAPQAHAGGIRAYRGATISGSIISDNFAGCDTDTQTCFGAIGGGVMADGVVHLVASQIYGNVAQAAKTIRAPVNGGGLYLTGEVTIEKSTISGNKVQGPVSQRWGGGIALNGDVLISGSTIDNNTADLGGGIFVIGGALSIVNGTVSSNTVSSSGGAIYAQNFPVYGPAPLIISNSTITLNASNGSLGGGGIVDNHVLTLGLSDFQSSIVAGNVNSVPGAFYDADLASSQPGASVTGANNLIVAAAHVTVPSDTVASDPLLGPLQDNGGFTLTHALLAGSPAIDTGNNAANLDFDQRGPAFIRVSGAAADMGAYEVQAALTDAIFTNGFDTL